VPPALDAICRKAMTLNPKQRYGTALELAADVEHWLADAPVAAWPEPRMVRTRRWLGKHRMLVTSGAATILVTLIACVIGLVLLAAAEEEQARARKKAEEKEREARDERDEANRQREEARENLYVEQINRVQREYEANNIGHVRELLDNWRV